jgi:hypothetical protein
MQIINWTDEERKRQFVEDLIEKQRSFTCGYKEIVFKINKN